MLIKSHLIPPGEFSDAALAVDIGATNLRICGCGIDYSHNTLKVLWTGTDPTGTEHHLRDVLLQAITKLQSTEGTKNIVLAAIGCPGIVSDDRRSAAITYLNPSKYLNIAEWLESAGVQRVVLFNDLELGCYGVTVTPPEQLHFLSGDLLGGTPDTFMVGMPGTGLGVGFWMNGTPHSSEGGHGLLAISPHDDVESRIFHGGLADGASSRPDTGRVTMPAAAPQAIVPRNWRLGILLAVRGRYFVIVFLTQVDAARFFQQS